MLVARVAVLLSLVLPAVAPCQQSGAEYSKGSLVVSGGSHGFSAGVDFQVSGKYFGKSSTRLYLDLGIQGIDFDATEFIFENRAYPSDARVIRGGLGVAQEFRAIPHVNLMPFVGIRAEYIRFTDKDLVEGIGDRSLIRYQNGQQVGAVVDSAYGDAITFDVGTRIAISLSRKIDLTGTVAYSPIKFDTNESLFGEFWGEEPFPNPYFADRKPLRLEAGLRLKW